MSGHTRLLALSLVLLAGALDARSAWGCAACECGDPTITTMGIEKPHLNRVRLGLETAFAGHTVGSDPDVERTWTWRSALVFSWSPTTRVTLGAMLPLVAQWSQTGARPWQTLVGLGDAELSVRGVLVRDRAFSPHHILSVLGGLKLPTGPRLLDGAGYPYPEDDQPGTGSWDPIVGLSYGWFATERWSAYASVSYRHTTLGRHDYLRGRSVGGSTAVQFQPHRRVALVVGVDVRWSAADQLQGGLTAPNSGGTSLALSPAIVVMPTTDWLIRLGAQIHVHDWLNGAQSETSAVILSTVIDLH